MVIETACMPEMTMYRGAASMFMLTVPDAQRHRDQLDISDRIVPSKIELWRDPGQIMQALPFTAPAAAAAIRHT